VTQVKNPTTASTQSATNAHRASLSAGNVSARLAMPAKPGADRSTVALSKGVEREGSRKAGRGDRRALRDNEAASV
jgi:hypothetical protein